MRQDALNIEKKLKSLEGVGEVTVVGYRDPEVRIFYDPERGRALGVTIQEVIGAIEGRNIFSTGGKKYPKVDPINKSFYEDSTRSPRL